MVRWSGKWWVRVGAVVLLREGGQGGKLLHKMYRSSGFSCWQACSTGT